MKLITKAGITTILILSFVKGYCDSDYRQKRLKLPKTSFYVAPFALIVKNVGSSVRIGLLQNIGEKTFLMAEGSYFLKNSGSYINLKGFQFESGVRYYLNNDDDITKPWISVSAGILNQSFTHAGILLNSIDTSHQKIVAQMNRRAQFIRFGIGIKLNPAKFWFIDLGFQLGYRHRDVDLQGLDEQEDNYFRAKTSDDTTSIAMQTTDMHIPDFVFLFRLGLDFNWTKK